jgi:anti-anti-sigma factor
MNTRIIKMKRANRSTRVAVLRLTEKEYGSNDEIKLALVRRLLMGQVERHDSPHLLVDFSAVESFGARFIAILVSTWKELEKRDRRLVLCRMSPFCRELIEVVQLHKLFDIVPTLQVGFDELEQDVPCKFEDTETAHEVALLDRSCLLTWQAERWQAPCSEAAVAC